MTSLSLAYSLDDTLVLTISAISSGSVTLNCWAPRIELAPGARLNCITIPAQRGAPALDLARGARFTSPTPPPQPAPPAFPPPSPPHTPRRFGGTLDQTLRFRGGGGAFPLLSRHPPLSRRHAQCRPPDPLRLLHRR